jgi:hypothetical protein
MARRRTWVTPRTGVIVPGGVVGTPEDRVLRSGQPVPLPSGYANHLVASGFAVASKAPAGPARPATSRPDVAGREPD